MTSPAVLEWDDLTDDQAKTLLTSVMRKVDTTADLLDFNLNVVQQNVPLLQGSGNVHWLGDATIHRDASFSIAAELPWGTSVMRLRQTMTDLGPSGLSAARDLGAFCLHTPDQVLGSQVRLPDGTLVTAWDVTGQDRLYLLCREVGHSYYIPGGTNVLAAIAQLYADAGVSGFLIDSSRDDATIPSDGMAWPLIVADSSAKRAWNGMLLGDPGSTDPTQWITILNDLHRLIAYRGVWADEHGNYRSDPYVDPADRGPSFTFDATLKTHGTVALDRTRSLDQWRAPNRWVFIRSNMPTGTSPTLGDGIYIVQNDDDGPSSVNARGGDPLGVWPQTIPMEAADETALEALGNARVADDKRATASFTVYTVPFPPAGHFDVFGYTEEAFGAAKVQAAEWTVDLWGLDTKWTWQAV